MAEEELGLLGSQRWIAAALRRRSGFPSITVPLVLFQRGWEHDGFQQVLVRQDALALVEAAPDRRNDADWVLHPSKMLI